MELVSSRLDFYKLFNHFVLWDVAQNHVLRVFFEDGESVGNASGVFLFLFLKH